MLFLFSFLDIHIWMHILCNLHSVSHNSTDCWQQWFNYCKQCAEKGQYGRLWCYTISKQTRWRNHCFKYYLKWFTKCNFWIRRETLHVHVLFFFFYRKLYKIMNYKYVSIPSPKNLSVCLKINSLNMVCSYAIEDILHSHLDNRANNKLQCWRLFTMWGTSRQSCLPEPEVPM